jgi:hypothetical protein
MVFRLGLNTVTAHFYSIDNYSYPDLNSQGSDISGLYMNL